MADLGKVVVTDGGTYSASVTYEKLTFVHYNNDAYLTLKTVKGVTPADDGVNYRLFCKSAATATTSKAGIVMPDGTTIGISNGKITAKTATQTTVGVTKGSDDITVGKDGTLSLNTKFEQATALANIVAGEALKVVLGKVSKAIATTMNLDENALLKNMISGIDVNDGNKVPSSAYIHTLVNRIGMGTELSGFDNLTAAVNSVNNNLSKAAIKSDLFSSGSITNPNTCTVPFSLVNGWHSAITNVPDAAKGKYSILLNIWEYGPSSTGNLTNSHMQALIIEKGGGIFTRLYINSDWSDWA